MILQQSLFPEEKQQQEKGQPEYTFFWQGPFSQWHLADITVAGMTFNCAEQFFMWSKAMTFGDIHRANKIMREKNPTDQRAIGREVAKYSETLWQAFRGGIAYTGNYAKFTQHPKLKFILLATRGTILVKASPHDTIWGIGLSETDYRAKRREQWRGLNLLGWTLTRVREAILFEEAHL